MKEAHSSDRHHKDSVQLKAWVPRELRHRFGVSCKAQGVPAASVLRDLIDAYCAQVEAASDCSALVEVGDGQG